MRALLVNTGCVIAAFAAVAGLGLLVAAFCRTGNATPTPRPPSPWGADAVEPATGTAHPSQAPATPDTWIQAIGRIDQLAAEHRQLVATRREIARLEAMYNHPSYRTEQP